MTPFFGPVKATVTGTPGTGAITMSAASAGYLAFSAIPSNIGLFCRVDDGSAWMTFYTMWNGTTLSAPIFVNSSTGSQLSLTSAAVVSPVPDPDEVQPHIGGGFWGMATAVTNTGTITSIGIAAPATNPAFASTIPASTNYLTMQTRVTSTSATTASAVCGSYWGTTYAFRSTTSFLGGFDCRIRFGASALPTGPRLMAGMWATASALATEEPSTDTNLACFGSDSTDSSIQFMVNDASGAATKTSTGIALAVNGFYEACIFCPPGGAYVSGRLTRLDTGAVWVGSASTDLPTSGTALYPHINLGLNATNTGTAAVLNFQRMFLRTSF